MSKRCLYPSVLLMVVLFSACSKKQSSTPINADLEKNFSFHKGSYWVYRDVISGQVDSLVITDDTYTTIQQNNGAFDFESHLVYIYENGVNCSYNSGWSLQTNSVNIYFEFTASAVHFSFGYPFLANGIYPYASDSTIVYNFDTLTINNNAFNNVCLMNYMGNSNTSPTYSYCNDSFFLCTNTGIVKMDYNQGALNNKFELVRYHVVQ